MKKYIVLALFALSLSSFSIQAQTACKQTAEQIANDFSAAFSGKKLDTLDANRGAAGKITVTIENSLSGKLTVKTFANLKAVEKWLTKREIDELPGRIANELVSCKKGVCSFKIDGLLHSTLFLKNISFGYTKSKCPFIKSIYIVDGV
jgi:hypothetical protein